MKTQRDGSILLNASEAAEITEILNLPIRAEGGFQRRMLALSALFGVDHPEYTGRRDVTQRGGFQRQAASLRNVDVTPRRQAAPAVNVDPAEALNMIKGLIKAGYPDQARDIASKALGLDLASIGAVGNSTATDVDNGGDDDETPAAQQQPKRRGKRRGRAAQMSKAKRSYAALQRFNEGDTRTINKRMAEKFGPEWRTLIGQ